MRRRTVFLLLLLPTLAVAGKTRNAAPPKEVTREQAERACRRVDKDDRDFCIEDVMENNDLEMVGAYI